MARYLGPKLKLSRRGERIFSQEWRKAVDSKCKIDNAPGQHGAKRTALGLCRPIERKQKVRRFECLRSNSETITKRPTDRENTGRIYWSSSNHDWIMLFIEWVWFDSGRGE